MKRRAKSLWVGIALLVGVLALPTAPAEAQPYFPEGWSILFFDATGFFLDCVDFVRCTLPQCPADFLFAGKRCLYDNVTGEFEPFRTETTISCNNIDFGFFPLVRRFVFDLNCNRQGGPFYGFNGFGDGSCGGEAVYRRIDPFGVNVTLNESWGGITIGGKVKCAGLFTRGADSLESLNLRRRMPR
jgi:hypothetical protein